MPAPVPVEMNGQRFASISEAARHFGVTRVAVWMAIEEGRNVGGRRGAPGVKCYVGGKLYPSGRAAAEAIGISPAAVSKRRAKMRAG